MTIVTIDQPFQGKFTIQTNCEELTALLRLKYGVFLKSGGGGCVLSAIRQGASYTLRLNGETIETAQPLFEIDRILFERNRYDESVFALHGAAVEWRGAAYLFLASTTGGKTTLASYLSSTGFGYITDDCILLERESFRVTPFPTPIHLREGGLQVLRRYGTAPEELARLDDPAFPRYIYPPCRWPGCFSSREQRTRTAWLRWIRTRAWPR